MARGKDLDTPENRAFCFGEKNGALPRKFSTRGKNLQIPRKLWDFEDILKWSKMHRFEPALLHIKDTFLTFYMQKSRLQTEDF